MPGYTVKGLDNLLEKMRNEMKYTTEICIQLEEDGNILELEKFDKKLKEYFKSYSEIFQIRRKLNDKNIR
jgi:hypothetical protein